MEAGSNARHIRKATMKVEQLSIFLENKAGRLAQVTKTLAEAGINIRALSLADTSDFGILRLIVNDTEKAINIMKEAGFTVGRTAVVAVEVDDKPGGLNNILEALSGQNVNVEYMYAFVQEGGGSATMIFRFDRIDQAIEVLKAKNIPIIPADMNMPLRMESCSRRNKFYRFPTHKKRRQKLISRRRFSFSVKSG